MFNDGAPEVPLSAFKHLRAEETNLCKENFTPDSNVVEKMINCIRTEVSALHTELMEEPHFPSKTQEALALVPLFEQPGLSPTFMSLVQSKKICLEKAQIDSNTNIFGLVRVLNLAYLKLVKVVWTNNNWKTVNENFAEYVEGSSEGETDKFSFRINCGEVTIDTKVELGLMVIIGTKTSAKTTCFILRFSINSFDTKIEHDKVDQSPTSLYKICQHIVKYR